MPAKLDPNKHASHIHLAKHGWKRASINGEKHVFRHPLKKGQRVAVDHARKRIVHTKVRNGYKAMRVYPFSSVHLFKQHTTPKKHSK